MKVINKITNLVDGADGVIEVHETPKPEIIFGISGLAVVDFNALATVDKNLQNSIKSAVALEALRVKKSRRLNRNHFSSRDRMRRRSAKFKSRAKTMK